MNVDGSLVIFFVRGDRELNEVKALKALNAKEISFANDELIATSNAVPGYTGPVGLNAKVVIDEEVLKMKNFCCGANKEGYHYINANVKDIKTKTDTTSIILFIFYSSISSISIFIYF